MNESIAAQVAPGVDPTAIVSPFLAMGAWGSAMVILGLAIIFLVKWLRESWAARLKESEAHADVNRQMLERVLTATNALGTIVSDNTKAIEHTLRSKNP